MVAAHLQYSSFSASGLGSDGHAMVTLRDDGVHRAGKAQADGSSRTLSQFSAPFDEGESHGRANSKVRMSK